MAEDYRYGEPYDGEGEAEAGKKSYILLMAAVLIMLAIIIFFTARVMSRQGGSRESLDALDKTINENAAILERTNSFASASQEHYRAIDQTLGDIQDKLSGYAERLERKDISGTEEGKQLRESVEELRSRMEEILRESEKSRSDTLQLLEEIRTSEATHTDTLNTQTEQIGEETKRLKETLEKRYEALMEDHSSLDRRIGELDDSFSRLIERYGSREDERHREMAGLLREAQSSLHTLIDTDYRQLTDLMDENREAVTGVLNTRIQELAEEARERHDTLSHAQEAVGGKLDALSASEEENHRAARLRLDSLAELLREMAGKETEQAAQISENVQNSIRQLFADYTVLNGSDYGELRTQLGALGERIDRSFTSVSSGKELLANALLTKGVDVQKTFGKDASREVTFSEFSKAVNDLPQTITVGDIPASSIHYTRHYHVDESGRPTGDREYTETAGGCFTSPYYHVHSAGCYRYYTMYLYGCENSTTVHDENGNPSYSVCRRQWKKLYDDGTVQTGSITCRHTLFQHFQGMDTERNYDIICGISTSEPLGYAPACGCLDGQIIKAEIFWGSEPGSAVEREAIPARATPAAKESGMEKAAAAENPAADAAAESGLSAGAVPGSSSVSEESDPGKAVPSAGPSADLSAGEIPGLAEDSPSPEENSPDQKNGSETKVPAENALKESQKESLTKGESEAECEEDGKAASAGGE
ncbi:hypothetical protein [Lachnoclostridium sp. Marseille-P6806]|uniref:hypothetical protein n=1 Tax=Lachnoclostridium sp. Marseille-P6806 TaxID=2364793 RepID=UPI0010317659|nr:hypothetical protein [Lachnoclostridium sp. Marseille-P6806]